MSAFAVTLDRLLTHLDHLESNAPAAALSAHVERASIRLRRAYAALQHAGPRAPLDLLIRLKGRAQEVEQALVDSAPPTHTLAQQLASQVVEQIEQHLTVASTAADSDSGSGSGSGGGHHSRTPSTSVLPRRLPSSSKSTTTDPDQPRPVKDAVQQRAQALSDCYTLARLAKSGVVPSAKPLSALLRLGRGGGGDGRGDSAAASARAAPPHLELEAQIKAQLRRAYFDSFRPLFHPGHNGGRHAAWTRLAQDLVEAVGPLIPPRMSADPALYPTESAAAAGDRTSMRTAVERDLLSTATASTSVHAEEEQEEYYLPKLERLVRVLQRLCAPARDPDVRAILDKLGAAIHPAPGPTTTTAAASAAAAKTSDRIDSAAASHQAELSAAALASSSDVPSTTTSQSPQQPDLEVVDLVREILDLAEAMRSDLDRFHTELKDKAVASSTTATTTLSEEELERVVEREAAMRERAVVLEWYGGEEENVRKATWRWCAERSAGADRSRFSAPESCSSSAAADPTTLLDRVVGREEFALALVGTLFASQPVAMPSLEATPPPPLEGNNLLPPPLVVFAPLLFELQNQLQALVILACLATIASSSSSYTVNSPPPAAADTSPLLEKLWTILDMNITRRPAKERIVPGLDKTSAAADDKEEEGTRLAHLADEILAHLAAAAASQDSSPVERAADRDPDLEKRVRASVDRILRYEDPVWKLFSKRLEGAVKTALLDMIRSDVAVVTSPSSDQVHPQVPAHLQTGRFTTSSSADERCRGKPLPPLTGAKRRAADLVAGVQPVKVKGFDKPAFLADKVSELVRDRLVGEVWTHVKEVWSSVLGWAE